MSRIGKLTINIPAGVTLSHEGDIVKVVGPKGELSQRLLPLVGLELTGESAKVTRRNDTIAARAAHGLSRQLVANMVIGVTDGFEKRLELKGVGYRATAEGDKKLTLNLGFSHPVVIDAPEGISFRMEKNIIVISGIDKQLVGEIASQIRRIRPPEPYKGKGVMYLGEHIRRKAGKAAKAGA